MCWKYTKLRLTFSRKKQLSYSSLIILETFKAKNISTIILSSCPMYVCQNLMNLICLTSNCAKFTPYTVNKICSKSGKFQTFISPKLKVLFWSWHIPDSESRRCWFLFSPKKHTTSRFWKYFVYYELDDSRASWAKKIYLHPNSNKPEKSNKEIFEDENWLGQASKQPFFDMLLTWRPQKLNALYHP